MCWPSPLRMTARSPDSGLDVAGQQVGRADEAGHEARRRVLVDGPRRAELLDPALVHDRDAVGHGQRLALVVRHVDERDADLALDPLELDLHGLAELEVKRAERLVEQQRPRPVHQGAGQRDPLLLAAGQLARAALLPAGEADGLDDLADPPGHLVLGDALAPQPERDVLEHAHVREQRVGLEHHVHVPLVRRDAEDALAVELDLAARGLLEPRDHPHRGGLAATGRAKEREELPDPDLQVDPGHGLHDVTVGAELLDDPDQFDGRERLGGLLGTGPLACLCHLSPSQTRDGPRFRLLNPHLQMWLSGDIT